MVSKRALRGTEPLGYVPPPGPLMCSLCDRPLEPGPGVDEHLLVPRSKDGKTKALKTHPEVAAFLKWVAGKPPAFYDNSRRPARRR